MARDTVVLRNGEKHRLTRYARTPDEAADALAKAVRNAKALDPSNHTIETFLDEWFGVLKPTSADPKKPQVRERTYKSRLRTLAPLLSTSLATGSRANAPAFASLRTKRIKDFTDADLRVTLQRMQESGIGSRTVQLAYEDLRAAWKYAVQQRYVDLNESPFLRVTKPDHSAKPKREIGAADLERLREAIQTTPKLRDRALFYILFSQGLRIGEALALTWPQVDLSEKRPCIHIAAQLNDVRELSPLKTTKSDRILLLDPALRQDLVELRAQSKSDFVFVTDKTNRPLDRSNVRSKAFASLIKRAKLEGLGLTLHSLRSILASLMSAEGANHLTLMAFFGWTNLQTAAKFYNRPTEATREAGLDTMVKALRRVGTTPRADAEREAVV